MKRRAKVKVAVALRPGQRSWVGPDAGLGLRGRAERLGHRRFSQQDGQNSWPVGDLAGQPAGRGRREDRDIDIVGQVPPGENSLGLVGRRAQDGVWEAITVNPKRLTYDGDAGHA